MRKYARSARLRFSIALVWRRSQTGEQNMSDGRPVFSHGLHEGDGDWRARELDALQRAGKLGAEVVYDMTPLPERPDPNVHSPQKGYGGVGILGGRDREIDPRQMGARVLPPDRDASPAPLSAPPMSGMTRTSRPGDPTTYSSSPEAKLDTVQYYGGSAQPRSGVSDTIAALRERDAQKDRRIAELERRDANRDAEIRGALGQILKKLDARPAARRRKSTRLSAAAKKQG
jgi:hypothetical protein